MENLNLKLFSKFIPFRGSNGCKMGRVKWPKRLKLDQTDFSDFKGNFTQSGQSDENEKLADSDEILHKTRFWNGEPKS